MNVLVLGASGLLGQALFKGIGGSNNVFGTIRDIQMKFFFPKDTQEYLIEIKDIFCLNELEQILKKFEIDVVINCISISDIYNQSEKQCHFGHFGYVVPFNNRFVKMFHMW